MPNPAPLPNSSLDNGPVRPLTDVLVNDFFAKEDGQLPEGGQTADGDADGEVEFPVRVRPGPPSTSQAEKDNHEATGHAVYRSWCSDCVQGRGRAKAHDNQKQREGESVPVLSWDYGFLGTKGSNRNARDQDAQDPSVGSFEA